MNTFIRATEVWVPSADGSLLEFGSGLFGSATRFGAVSRSMCFGRGEGLPGRAWDEGRPLLLKEFTGSYFRRTAEAHAAGLSCAVALPIFVADALTAVLVFFCGDVHALGGAIELWRNNARVSGDMTLVDGVYGQTAEAFEAISRDAFLPRGAGLPGLAWQRGEAVVLDTFGAATQFLRADAAAQAGIDRGLALPCATHEAEVGADSYVLTLFSGHSAPIADRVECWAPDAARQRLQRIFAFGDGGNTSAPGAIPLESGAGPITDAHMSGVPVLRESPSASGPSLVAIPIINEGAVVETVVMYFA